tara:strand:+ start:1235 stop:1447 length:213 start_codon:yes stop_codon:yes gene_type:complete
MTTQEYIDHALANGLWAVEYKVTSVLNGGLATETEVQQFYSLEEANEFIHSYKTANMNGILYHGIVLHTK